MPEAVPKNIFKKIQFFLKDIETIGINLESKLC